MAGQAGISFEEMMGEAAPQPQSSSDLPSGAITADQMFGGAAAEQPSDTPGFFSAFGEAGKKYWTDYVRLSNEYAEALKSDAAEDPRGLADQVTQAGKTLLHLMGAAFSPAESAARTGIIEPIQAAVSKMSGLAAQHLAAPDVYNAQQRRERWLMGQPVKQQYPAGVDWQIHQADVERTAEGLNQFLETGVLTGVGFIGPGPGKTALAEAGEASLPIKNMIRLAPVRAATALQGLRELSEGALSKLPGLKDSVERLTANIKDLAIKDPQAVQDLAVHVGKVDPVIGSEVERIGKEAQALTPEAQEALGEQLAKPRVRQVGTTPEGKPILRLVKPEQGVADTVAEGYEALKTSSTTPPEVVRSANEAYTAQLLREEGLAPVEHQGYTYTPDTSFAHRTSQYVSDWHTLHGQMEPRYEDAFHTGRPIGAHAVLDTLLDKARALPATGDFFTELLSKIRQNVEDIPVSFKQHVLDAEGAYKVNTMGHYRPHQNDVEIVFRPGEKATTSVVVHELVHAATYRWMKYNETHPLMQEMRELYAVAKSKLSGHYGLKNTEEFVAEAFSNSRFQEALSRIKTGKVTLWEKLSGIISRIFGLRPGEESLLESVLRTGGKIAETQKKFGSGPMKLSDVYPEGPPGFSTAKVPGLPVVMGKLKEYYSQIIQTLNPEAFGHEAKAAAAVIAKRIAQAMQKDSAMTHQAAERRGFWNKNLKLVPEFLKKFESGQKFTDPAMEKVALYYRLWNERIYNQDLKNGFDYEPVDNYIYHSFEDSAGVEQFFNQRYGAKWNNPAFLKDRGFEMYEQAVAAGFKPRFTNPEDIMLARQHASDVAQMRVEILEDLEGFGLAKKVVKGQQPPTAFPATEWRAPNGERYWVHNTANRVMQNAFNTKSLWTMPGLGGDLFRGAMWLKNTIVPIKLAMSLFHPLHVATIDNATGMVRATKGLLSGTTSASRFLKEMTESLLYKDLVKETAGQLGSLVGFKPSGGHRLLQVYQGKISKQNLTAADVDSLRLMAEGGFIPEMSSQYRTQAWDRFRSALQRRSLTAAWHLPFAAIDLLQRPMFQVWIPSLKIASYLKDVQTAFRTDPTLMSDSLKRQIALRKISKSVDNRYGEMAYNTLFWNRWVKDLAVANTLSLGWQMGFIREYGGGAMDLGQFALKPGSPVQKIKSGLLDRPMFASFYTAQALAYGGLMTWALTGQTPQDLMDYIYPKNGEENPDGTPQRVTTMFYPREFAAIYKHMENEGVVSGLGHLAQNKASGVVGLTTEWATGVDSFGRELRDPNAPAYKQIEQTLAHTLGELEPISVDAIRKSTGPSTKSTVMNIAGFGPAPKYITESRTEAAIKGLYQKYYAPRQTPFEKAQYSEEFRELRRYWDAGDQEKFGDLLDQMQEKFELTGKELRLLERKLQSSNSDEALQGMFSRLTWQQQKRLLDQMTEDERAIYLPKSNRQHLRYNYEPPEK